VIKIGEKLKAVDKRIYC